MENINKTIQKKKLNIWFGTTTSKWPTYKSYYFKIRNLIKEANCSILYDWLEQADNAYKNNIKRNIDEIFNEVIKAIDMSDAVIIEYTVPNFSSSHQINYALLKKKPVLVLRLKKDNPYYSDSYIDAIQSPLITIKDYTLKIYTKIIKEFLITSSPEEKQKRYNIVLGSEQKSYLDWASFKYKMSKSQIIKDLINEKLAKDKNYKDK